MDIREAVNRLEFDKEVAGNHQIQTACAHVYAAVADTQRILKFMLNPQMIQLDRQRPLVNGLQKTGSERAVDFYRGANHAPRQLFSCRIEIKHPLHSFVIFVAFVVQLRPLPDPQQTPRFFVRHLDLCGLAVVGTGLHQLVVRADLRDPAVLHDHHDVRTL